MQYPKNIEPKTDDLLLSVPDYMPAILGLMGLGDKVPKGEDGKDYSDVFFNKLVERPDKQLYFGAKPTYVERGARGFKTLDHTFAVLQAEDGRKHYYLYNDKADPYQMGNIWGENPQLDNQMEADLATLLKSMNDSWIKE